MLWNEKYETGNREVDDEHREIFDLVQKVIDATFKDRGEKMETIIDFLANYTIQHFNNEERLMEESGYPHTGEHKRQHAEFLEEVVKLKKKVLAEADRTANNVLINKVIVNWLTKHVLGSDMMMAAHYRKWGDLEAAKAKS
ncbi:MAG: hemerythrin family protein [Defluviitaleaceae bacterium]|nr:hemerythrin family protein [Defluviitaleaceae bacterium]